MKILFDHKIFLLQKYGGISRYISKLNYNLNLKNIDSKIISPISINKYLINTEKNQVVHFHLKKVYRFCNKLFNFYNDQFSNYYINKFKPNIIHRTYYKPGYTRYKFKKFITVITVYDLIHEKFSKMYNLKNENKWKEKYLSQADHIICISRQTQDDLLKFYNINREKTSIVHLGSEFNLEADKHLQFSLKKKQKFLLYVGDRKRYKNFKKFIHAFSLSRELQKNFKIVCCGSVKFTEDEKKYFKKININLNDINYFEASDNLLAYFYKNATCLVFPSKYEGFGLPAIEAMSYGCPVIASDIKIFREILGENASYFDPDNEYDIKKILEENILSNDKLIQLSKNGFEHSKNYTWQKCADETLKVYKKII